MSTPGYDERLSVPLRWWVQGIMFEATLWLAMIVSMPAALAWGLTAAIVALLVLAFNAYGSARLVVADGVLRAGRARIEATYLGTVEALDPEATRRVAGMEADARAFLLLRPYLKRAVKVQIVDPADPAPYWLLSTRHPDRLAAAIQSLAADAR
ncbi:DUF3093 domain-containing protein [Nocardioides sp. BP30]|uniref:DUF3093 domain-containing protein n=1 Tax=Nocardioides sp. BP30 TaxID=3036374 RepID=UPI00246876C0|nr:DUF3093 domain-containing protein [Nocardioides sp. BP30]WGL53964.1 DUF3093 domain-containing protein [Nocardioides sp. BP30]